MSKKQLLTWAAATLAVTACCLWAARAQFMLIALFLGFTPFAGESAGEFYWRMRWCVPVALLVCTALLLWPYLEPETRRYPLGHVYLIVVQAITILTELGVLYVGLHRGMATRFPITPRRPKRR